MLGTAAARLLAGKALRAGESAKETGTLFIDDTAPTPALGGVVLGVRGLAGGGVVDPDAAE